MLKVGDKVKVIRGSGRLADPIDGEVTKVGRVWATIKYGEWSISRFRMNLDPRSSRAMRCDDHFSYPAAYTVEQWANRERRAAAVRYLNEVGIEIRIGRDWDDRHIELAELLQAYQGQSTKDSEGSS